VIEYKFYDTSSLLLKAESLDKDEVPMVISSITLDELEKIKTNCNKDISVKVAARHVSDFIWEHGDLFTIHIFKESMLKPIVDADLTITNDLKILATAIDYKQKH
jgi:predicted nucleic acid-binding protein